MKCNYCGGEVGLEEELCPYCGRPNEQALQHHRNMASFRRRFAQTETEVMGRTERYAGIVPRTILIVIFLIITIVAFFVAENSFSVPEDMRRRAAERHPESYRAVLDQFLEEKDYISFASYLSFHDIRTYRTAFSEYNDLQWSAEYYQGVVEYLERLFLHQETEDWLRFDASNDVLRLCQELEYFMDAYERGVRDSESASHRAILDDMRNNVLEMLHVFLGIDGDEIDDFLKLSDNRKAALIEEVLFNA